MLRGAALRIKSLCLHIVITPDFIPFIVFPGSTLCGDVEQDIIVSNSYFGTHGGEHFGLVRLEAAG
jgi:hypothetical protein